MPRKSVSDHLHRAAYVHAPGRTIFYAWYPSTDAIAGSAHGNDSESGLASFTMGEHETHFHRAGECGRRAAPKFVIVLVSRGLALEIVQQVVIQDSEGEGCTDTLERCREKTHSHKLYIGGIRVQCAVAYIHDQLVDARRIHNCRKGTVWGIAARGPSSTEWALTPQPSSACLPEFIRKFSRFARVVFVGRVVTFIFIIKVVGRRWAGHSAVPQVDFNAHIPQPGVGEMIGVPFLHSMERQMAVYAPATYCTKHWLSEAALAAPPCI